MRALWLTSVWLFHSYSQVFVLAGSFMQPGQVDSTRSAAESERAGAGEQLAEAAMDSSSGGSSSQSDDSSSTSSGSWQAPDAALPGQVRHTFVQIWIYSIMHGD